MIEENFPLLHCWFLSLFENHLPIKRGLPTLAAISISAQSSFGQEK
jgi:hypothetical protein